MNVVRTTRHLTHLPKRGQGLGLDSSKTPVLRAASEIVRAAPAPGLDLRTYVNMAGGLRFAVLFAASSFGVLLLAASASSSPLSRPPEVYSVGDDLTTTGRAAPPGNEGGTQTTLSSWATRQRFYVGDVLDFKRWRSDSVLLLVRQADYERCSAASPVRRFFAGGGDTRFTLARPGLFYFISGAPARCEAGERMVVRVVDHDHPFNNSSAAPTPTPAPAPAPGTEPAATLSKLRRSGRLSIPQMQMVAGAVGFAAGFVTTFLIVGIGICFWP